MAKLPERFIEEVKDRTSLADLIGKKVKLIKKGNEHTGLCPFHSEKTGSFTVNETKGFYHCFGCGAHGGSVDFIMNTEGRDFREAVEQLAYMAGMEIPVEPKTQPNEPPRKELAPKIDRQSEEDALAAKEADRLKAFEYWKGARDIKVSGPVYQYLTEVRGIRPDVFMALPTLKETFLDYWDTSGGKPVSIGKFPVMIAPFQFADGKFAGAHMTFLEPDGSDKLKRTDKDGDPFNPKKMRGHSWGCAIRLCESSENMGGAEGIETSLSVNQAGFPCWALGSQNNMAGRAAPDEQGTPHPDKPGKRLPVINPAMDPTDFWPPVGVKEWTWWEDNDCKDILEGDAKMQRASLRIAKRNLKCLRAKPPRGMDFNDVLRGGEA